MQVFLVGFTLWWSRLHQWYQEGLYSCVYVLASGLVEMPQVCCLLFSYQHKWAQVSHSCHRSCVIATSMCEWLRYAWTSPSATGVYMWTTVLQLVVLRACLATQLTNTQLYVKFKFQHLNLSLAEREHINLKLAVGSECYPLLHHPFARVSWGGIHVT